MRLILVFATLLVVSCGSGDGGTGFVLEGRVVSDASFSTGVAGMTVRCPAAAAMAVTDADGYFTLEGTVGEEAPGVLARLGVWFEGEGIAAVSRTFRPIRNVRSTAVVIAGKALKSREVAVPKDKQSQAVTFDNATVTLFHDSLAGADGAPVTSGKVDVAGATWEPIFADRQTIPAHPVVEPLDGNGDFVVPLVMTRFAVSSSGSALRLGGTQGVGLYMTSVNPTDGAIEKDDGRIFHVDESTGVLVEKPSNKLDTQNNVLQASAGEPGTWVWARDVPKPTCVNVEATFKGGGPVLGANARLVEDLGSGNDGLAYDEIIGAGGGLYCLRGPVGKTMRIRAWLAGAAGMREASQNVLMGAGGDCDGGCPKSFVIEFPCENDAECGAGSVCSGGECEAAPDPGQGGLK